MNTVIRSDEQKYYRTRFDDKEQRLLYAHVTGTNVGYTGAQGRRGKGRQVSFWGFFHQQDHGCPMRVGPEYPSKEALLADMERFVTEYGFA